MYRKLLLLLFFAIFLVQLFNSCKRHDKGNDNVVQANRIIEQLREGKKIVYHDKTIEGKLDFSVINNAPEATGLMRAYIDQPVSFIKCTFTDTVTTERKNGRVAYNSHFTKSVSFIDCNFNQAFNFQNAAVDGNLNFAQSIFYYGANFNGLDARGKVNYFTSTIFKGDLQLQQVRFLGNLSLFKAEIDGNLVSQNGTFHEGINLGKINLKQTAHFTLCNFNRKVYFNFSKIGKNLVLRDNSMMGELSAEQIDVGGEITIEDNRFYDRIQLKKTDAGTNYSLKNNHWFIKPDTSLIQGKN